MKKQTKSAIQTSYTEKVGSSGPFRAVVMLENGETYEGVHSTRNQAAQANARVVSTLIKAGKI